MERIARASLLRPHLALERKLERGGFLPAVLPALLAASVEPECFADTAGAAAWLEAELGRTAG